VSAAAHQAEVDELRRCLRDVLALLALPAAWRELPPAQILTRFSEALENMVDPELLVASMRSSGTAAGVVRLHRADAEARRADVAKWLSCIAGASTSTVQQLSCGELGELTVVFEPIGYYAALGHLVVASRRAGFPSSSELVTIRAATSLATTAIEAASAMQAREEALRAKDDFMALLGHELRNPLAPIRSSLDLLRGKNQGKLPHEAQVIDRQVEHLTRLVDDLLDVARITRGTLELKPSVFEMGEVIEQAVEGATSLFESRRHQLAVECPPSGLPVEGDRFRLLQVVANLLSNAARYTPEGGHVELRVTRRDQRLLLCVRDDGIGMTRDFLPRVFDAFVQAQRAYGPQYGGLGIGLALVQKVVTLHGGQVRARSDGPGMGSEFEVELPLAPGGHLPTEAAPAEVRGSGEQLAMLRIMVVDDNVDSGEMLGEVLSMAGHEVRVVHDPLEAAAQAVQFKPDIVFLDLSMPGLDGFGVAAEIRRQLGEQRPALVAVTGYGQESDRQKTAAAGFRGHLVKPVDLKKLLAQVELLRAERS
jgi:signal transduction histidine kinase/CheY-like chemotaxis protein